MFLLQLQQAHLPAQLQQQQQGQVVVRLPQRAAGRLSS
jgi:hypothetical protein